jgi:two-component sensor histidine kinase/DNA-binding response OmpR family regulator
MDEVSVHTAQGITILIVGDDPANLRELEKTLQAHRYRALFAHDGANGLEHAVHDQPDLILMDAMMPGMDGFETCRRLKEKKKTRDIPVILMTVNTEKDTIVKGFAAGAVDYITKPILGEEVTARISPHLLLNSVKKKLKSSNIQIGQEIEYRRRFETTLKKHKEQLEKRVTQQAAELGSSDEMLCEIEQSNLKEAERMRRALLSILEDEKLAKKKVEASLQEKQVLLREIHHRVKNNLQIVSSLLQLQAGHTKDEQTIRMFNESQMQIRTMAMVHEKLYQNENMSMVDFGDFVKSITDNLFQFYPHGLGQIRFTVEIDNIFMSIDKAIPCGMIINELVSNSFKYGFPEESKGEIGIKMKSKAQNEFELTVYDNGTGIPESVDYRNTETLGLHLVTILTEDQLQGQIKLDTSDGTKFRIQF